VWRRAALAALIGVIAFFGHGKYCTFCGWKFTSIGQPEGGLALSPKGVSVFDAPIQKYSLRYFFNVRDFIWCQNPRTPKGFWHYSSGADIVCEFLFQCFGCEQAPLLIERNNINVGPTNNFVSGSLTRIFEIQNDKWPVGVFWHWWLDRRAIKKCGGIGKDIGAQLSPACFHHDPNGSDQSEELKEANKNRDPRDFVTQIPTLEPTIAPLLYSMIAGGFGFILCLFGLLNLDNNRRLLAAIQLGCGLLLGGFGFLLWIL